MLLTQLINVGNLVLGLKVLSISLVAYLLSIAIYNRYFHPYKDFPGPFWASITGLWYWRAARFARVEDHQLPLHKKYGTMVRITPDHVQISDPAAIETIYGPKKVFQKSAFYDNWNPHMSHRGGTFDERDEHLHGLRRRIVAPLYTQGSILEFEPCVDRCIALFYNQMETFANNKQSFDIATWFRKYTFDIVGEIFYGREGGFGFIRDNVDYNSWCRLMETMPAPAAANPYAPKLLRGLMFGAEFLSSETRTGAQGFYEVISQSWDAVNERLSAMKSGQHKTKHDMLTKLIDLVNDSEDPKTKWTINDVAAELHTVIWAGSDTTAIALTSIFYHLHKHPAVLAKLRAEVDDAFANGTLTSPLRYNDCVKLPYLHAVVREGMRIHSSLGLGLPRLVPKGGAYICGKWFPEGQAVTMTASAVHFDKGVFGEDSESFVPERWLRDGEKKAAEMERCILQFGYGPRVSHTSPLTCTSGAQKMLTDVDLYRQAHHQHRNVQTHPDNPARLRVRYASQWGEGMEDYRQLVPDAEGRVVFCSKEEGKGGE
jgi:cytochrome P450